MQLNSQSVSQF